MPQMAPMPWVSLEFFFLGCMFIFLSVAYFSPESGGAGSKGSLGAEKLNWRW